MSCMPACTGVVMCQQALRAPVAAAVTFDAARGCAYVAALNGSLTAFAVDVRQPV